MNTFHVIHSSCIANGTATCTITLTRNTFYYNLHYYDTNYLHASNICMDTFHVIHSSCIANGTAICTAQSWTAESCTAQSSAAQSSTAKSSTAQSSTAKSCTLGTQTTMHRRDPAKQIQQRYSKRGFRYIRTCIFSQDN